MTTGQLIKEARKKAGMTQKQLAEKLGISYVNISQLENDQRVPKYKTILSIADALGVEWMKLVPEEQQGQIIADHLWEKLKNTKPLKKISVEDAYRLGVLNIVFKSEEDRIAFFYGKLNTDGKLIASKCFYQHLAKESVSEVADYVEKLSEIPQYQRAETAPQSPPVPAEGKDTTSLPDAPETPPEGE